MSPPLWLHASNPHPHAALFPERANVRKVPFKVSFNSWGESLHVHLGYIVALPFSACEIIRNSEKVSDVDVDVVLNSIRASLGSGIGTVPTCYREPRSTVCPLHLGFGPCRTRDMWTRAGAFLRFPGWLRKGWPQYTWGESPYAGVNKNVREDLELLCVAFLVLTNESWWICQTKATTKTQSLAFQIRVEICWWKDSVS